MPSGRGDELPSGQQDGGADEIRHEHAPGALVEIDAGSRLLTPQGITAGFSAGLPNLPVGVFSLENLSLAAGFSVPLVGPPMSTWFRFCPEHRAPGRILFRLERSERVSRIEAIRPRGEAYKP